MNAKRTPEFEQPEDIAKAAEAIYAEKYKDNLESQEAGKFVVIDVLSEGACVGEFPEKTIIEATEKFPDGVFHLIRVGSPQAFKVGYGERSYSEANSWAG